MFISTGCLLLKLCSSSVMVFRRSSIYHTLRAVFHSQNCHSSSHTPGISLFVQSHVAKRESEEYQSRKNKEGEQILKVGIKNNLLIIKISPPHFSLNSLLGQRFPSIKLFQFRSGHDTIFFQPYFAIKIK